MLAVDAMGVHAPLGFSSASVLDTPARSALLLLLLQIHRNSSAKQFSDWSTCFLRKAL